ncbi:MAG: hypothetical protein K8S24_02800 [Candidatus Aegiribacteria sp.]|nr:hypothetical protein [Candidatus Aegiribacteria sp.]
MKLFISMILCAAVLSAELIEFTASGVLLCDGFKIDVGSYAAPLAVDWNGDGKKDLICGQYEYGRIRFYPNVGTNSAPVFEEYFYLLDGAGYLSVPYG